MAKDIQLNVTAKDDASKTLDKIADKGERLDGLTAEVAVGVDDNATDALEKVDEEVQGLEGGDATVSVDADDQASDELTAVGDEVDGLDGASATVTADVDDAATGELDTIGAAVDDLDGASPQITPEVDDSAIDDLTSIADAADELDGLSPEITPQADTTSIDNLSGAATEATGSSEKLSGAVGFLEGKLSSSAGEAGGMVEALSGITGAAGPAGLGIAAAGAAAYASAEKFGSLALEAQNFSTVSGTSLDTASRWIEVSGDLGVSAETVESAIGRMNKNIGSGKVSLDELGIAAGGSSENFTALLAYIGGITDETQQAAEGARIFGKAWQGLAPLIVNVGELNSRLGQVSDQKIITPDKVKSAEALRDAMDGLHDAIEDVVLTIGSFTVGPITDAVAVVGNLRNAFEEVKDSVKGIPVIGDIFGGLDFGPLKGVTSGIKALRDVTDTSNGVLNAYRSGLGDLASQLPGVGGALDDLIGGESAAEAATRKAADAARDAAKAADEEAFMSKSGAAVADAFAAAKQRATDAAHNYQLALEAETKALQEQVDSSRNAADSFVNLGSKTDDMTVFTEGLSKAQGEAGDNQLKINQLNRDGIDHTTALADATTRYAEETAKATGMTYNQVQKQDDWNTSMVTSASQLSGPVQQSVIAYIGQVNQIPPEKMTEIQAAIAAGDIEEAERLINEASRTRNTMVKVNADTSAAEHQINTLMGSIRNFVIPVQFQAKNTPAQAAASAAGTSVVGQPTGVPAVATAAATPTAHPGVAPVVNNVRIDVHVKVDPLVNQTRVGKAVADALDAYWRSSGRRPRAAA